jgi:hypothetical protein
MTTNGPRARLCRLLLKGRKNGHELYDKFVGHYMEIVCSKKKNNVWT